MATTAELRQRLADIDTMLATGINSSGNDGQTTTFDLESLRRERKRIRRELGIDRPRSRLFHFKIGHGSRSR